MHRAVAARLMTPELSLLEALLEGGFSFPDGTEGSGKSDRNIFDSDGVLLCQRKNQLSRRLRLAKKRQQQTIADGNLFNPGGGGQGQGDSRTLQNMLLNGQLPVPGNEMGMMPSHQFGTPFFPGQHAGALDPSAMASAANISGNKRKVEGNMDQYLQHTARSMGLRPDQFQSLRYPNPAIFPGGFPGNLAFPQFSAMANQSANLIASMDQQNGGDGGGVAPPNMQMPPAMMAMTQQQYNNDLNRMLLNRSILMNVMEHQQQQQLQQQQQKQQQPQLQPLPQPQQPQPQPQQEIGDVKTNDNKESS